jgi:hypothetical protein
MKVAMSIPATFLVFACLSGGTARAADNTAVRRLTVSEIVAESPAAVQKLIGVYSEIPGYAAAGKSVKLYVFKGTDLVCISPLKGTQQEKFSCWHFNEAPEQLQKLVNEKDAAFQEN